MKENCQDCLFFHKVDAGNCWELGCRVLRYYCQTPYNHADCKFYVPSSDQKHVVDLLTCCIDHLQANIPAANENGGDRE